MKTSTKLLIDTFGVLCAQVADLEAQKKSIRQQLIGELRVGAYEGIAYRVTISESVRETLDMDAVREKLSPQFIAAHTKSTPVITVKAGARNNINVEVETASAKTSKAS